ncbi:MAG: C25 family cysteine peptidase [Bacteroidota bacterium]
MRQILLLFTLVFTATLSAQMAISPDEVRYGNEWLAYDTDYLRLEVVDAGIYRISNTELATAGWSLSPENANRWALYHEGELVPVYVTDQGIHFYGKGNDGYLDQFLFENSAQDQLNPKYSLYADTAVYFLRLTQVPTPGAQQTEISAGEANGLTPEPYLFRTSEVVFSDHTVKSFIRNQFQGISIFYSHYEPSEGYGSRSTNDLLSFNGTTESPFSLALPRLSPAADPATIDVRYGLGFDSHDQILTVDGEELDGQTSSNWSVEELSATFTPGSTTVNGSLIGRAGDRDKANLASVSISYPAATALDVPSGMQFRLRPSGGGDKWLRFSEASTNGAHLLFNLSRGSVQREENAENGFRLTNANANDAYFVINEQGSFQSPLNSSTVRFTDYRQLGEEMDFLILTSEKLYPTESGPIQEYANYRRSIAGGNHAVSIVKVEDLYDQYSYGVQRHPLGIRNFVVDLANQHPELKYLFLIGKGREYNDLRNGDQLAAAEGTFFLPSFGLPASDNLISAPLGSVVPRLATGRLSVINPAEVGIYLNKIREFDRQINNQQTLEGRDWMKQIIHLGGGGQPGEQQSIRNQLTNMESTIEASSFGANVNSFYKTSSEPIEESRQNAIFDRINGGTSVITFFGHSSSQGFDFSIDNPDNYFNREKYPLMLSLGCYSGDAFTSLRSIGERFVLLEDKGAIAFGASKGLGYVSALGSFANNFYRLLGEDFYGQGIGDALNANIANFSSVGSFSMRILLEQFSLNGDPSIRLNPHPGPDLVIDPNSIRFEPRVVPAQQDSFTVNIRVVNIGKGVTDSVDIAFIQRMPNNTAPPIGRVRLAAPMYDANLAVKLPNQGFPAVGLNDLIAVIDASNEVEESPAPTAEQNNLLMRNGRPGVPFYVVANTARPAFPPPYALHTGQEQPVLTSSTTNPLAVNQRYFLEVADNQSFSNPLDRGELTQEGGLIRWNPNVNWQDSTVYYWRISPDSVNNEGSGLIWNESSFTYLQNNQRAGWGQSHEGQLNRGKYTNIQAAENGQAWRFSRSFNDIRIRNKVYDPNDPPRFEFNGQIFGSPFPWFVRAGVQMIVIDTISNSWDVVPPGGDHGSISNNRPQDVWGYDTRTQQGRADMMNFIENVVDDGKYILLYTSQRGDDIDYGSSEWISDSLTLGRTLFGVLEDQGALQVRQLNNVGSVPYVFIFQKNVGPIAEVMAESQDDLADVLFNTGINWPEGDWTSDPVGPAQSWENLELAFLPQEISAADSAQLKLYGLPNSQASGVLLREEVLDIQRILNFSFDISNISASVYPYLFAEVELFDADTRTSATLKSAFFHYQPTADVAIDPAVAFSSSADSLERGQDIELEIGFTNISNQAMDSLLIALSVSNEAGNQETVTRRVAPLGPAESSTASFSVNSTDLSGNTQLRFQLNPEQDQPEEIIFNNDLVQSFFLDQDAIDPLLNVFFDGVSIRDGDIVSPTPEILLELRDENEYLLLNDTAAFELSLRMPDGTSELIAFADPRIEFIPATSTEENEADIYFRPELTQDGLYEIRIQATDRSENTTGRLDFIREFEVINEQRIANVFNYPNPFSNATQFVYTLTGNETPEVFRIQIMTISGRVVKDIDLSAEEALKIGTHRTEYTWDGTDEYGDQLANGVYLYRVITRNGDGEELTHHDNGTDQFFKNRMGKMVILR